LGVDYFILPQCTRTTDRQTDGQTDGRTDIQIR